MKKIIFIFTVAAFLFAVPAYSQNTPSSSLRVDTGDSLGEKWARWVSTSFLVYFDPEEKGEKEYAKRIIESLEKAYKAIFGDLGFEAPEWMKSYRVTVLIKDWPAKTIIPKELKERFKARPSASTAMAILSSARATKNPFALAVPPMTAAKRGKSLPFIEFNKEKYVENPAALIPIIAAHEFFHIVQYGYTFVKGKDGQWKSPEWKHNWLFEGTARWLEDKVIPYTVANKNDWHDYGYYSEYRGWTSGSYQRPIFSSENDYSSSYFFQYLTEREPGNNNVIRKLWSLVKTDPQDNTFDAVAKAVGGENNLREFFSDFAAAGYVMEPKWHPTYSFKIHGQKETRVRPSGKDTGLERIRKPQEFSLKKMLNQIQSDFFSVDYRLVKRISGDDECGSNANNIVIGVRESGQTKWGFWIIKSSGPSYRPKKMEIHNLSDSNEDNNNSFRLFQYRPDKNKDVVLVSANLNYPFGKGSYEYFAVEFGPPVIEFFRVKQNNKDIREIKRKQEEDGTWSRRYLQKGKIRYNKEKASEIIVFQVGFNRPMNKVNIFAGKEKLVLTRADNSKLFTGKVSLKSFKKYLASEGGQGYVPVRVEAAAWPDPEKQKEYQYLDSELPGFSLDEDPSTKPDINSEGELTGWEVSESPGEVFKIPVSRTAGTSGIRIEGPGVSTSVRVQNIE